MTDTTTSGTPHGLHPPPPAGLRVQGAGFRVQGSGFRVRGARVSRQALRVAHTLAHRLVEA